MVENLLRAHGFPSKPVAEKNKFSNEITFERLKLRESFFVQGPRKSGKTSLLTFIAREEIVPKKVSFTYFKIDDLIGNITESWNSPATRKEYVSRIKNTHVIFVDGLGNETASKELTIKALCHFFGYRADEGKPVILASYIPFSKIIDFYGEDVFEYVRDFTKITLTHAFSR